MTAVSNLFYTCPSSWTCAPAVTDLILDRWQLGKFHVSNSYLGTLKSLITGTPMFHGKEEYLEFGRELHKRVLEPWKPWKILSEEDERKLAAMVDALKSHPGFGKKLKTMHHEIEFNRVLYQGGPVVNMILDLFDIGDGDDLKSSSTASEEAFIKSALRYDYFRQAWMYATGCRLDTFAFWGCEKTEYSPRIYKLPVMDFCEHLQEGQDSAMILMETHQVFTKMIINQKLYEPRRIKIAA